MNDDQHLVLGTAGHIDHGKTALSKAITGADTDRGPVLGDHNRIRFRVGCDDPRKLEPVCGGSERPG